MIFQKNLKNKYKCIENNLFGINEYLNLLNVNMQFNDCKNRKFLNKIVDNMIK